MNHFPKLIFALFVIVSFVSCGGRSGKPRVLVFSKTSGFRHSSIAEGKAAILKLGQENGFLVDTTENAEYFNEDSLKNYSAVIFLNPTGNVLNNYQEADFERYIQAGGGYVGIHAASDCEYDWGWYGRLVGAYFESHPHNQKAKLKVVDANHPSTKHLPNEWVRTDEWYNFKNLNKDVKVLLTIDENSYEGGKNGDHHPMAWYHDYDGGRAFYTELGHTEESYKEENFLKHILGGIQYAIGDNDELNYKKAITDRVPEEDRFSKTILASGVFFEPTEMTILPNFDILIAQRRGEVLLYRKADSSMKQVGFLNVYHKTSTPGVNAEEGLMGIQADPDFAKNRYVYLFYSPIDTSVNRLSRFTFNNDTLDPKSEKIVLQFYSQREICCHTGGSIAFGPDRLLYLSTGDNSTPFDEPNQKFVNRGFAPLDDRPGHEQYDARRSSGNSQDLRGKILRIRIKEDGSYEIPEGNLFPANSDARPEIYVMGNRNPYRISVDQKTGFLYWGEVGPDAANDSLQTRGPRGYDEVNQARKAGFFGWPLFVGNNYAYKQYDYATGSTGANFDPAKPVNNSRNNTGLQELPPAQPAFIWYPYAESSDFPQVGSGGRNAMTGPIYYTDMYPKETRLPDYYNDKLFIYDWIRGWVKAVTMQADGDFDKMEPFMKSTKLNAPIDMEVGPDGRLYILEYGSGWFSKNPDAALSRIDYNAGNRVPVITALHVDKGSGSLPFAVTAHVEARDPEKKPMKYTWNLGNGETKQTDEPRLQHTYTKVGEYAISVTVTDEENAIANSKSVSVYAGNETPTVQINLTGNKTFYFPGQPVQYQITVNDKDDPGQTPDMSNLVVSADYLEGTDKAASPQGHLIMTEVMTGKNLMLSLDCKTCHKEAEKSIGPSYVDVAKRYQKDANAVSYLAGKMIKGSSGVWGETAMPAHPDLPESDARQIAVWIQSLAGENKEQKSLPAQGSVQPTLNKPARDNGVLYLTGSYTDKGGNNIKPLTGHTTIGLRSGKVTFEGIANKNGFESVEYGGSTYMIVPKTTGWFSIDSIDLTDIKTAVITAGWQQGPEFGYTFELRLDSPDGKKLGEVALDGVKGQKNGSKQLKLTLEPITDGKLHNLYIVSKVKDPKEPNMAGLQSIQFGVK